MKNLRQKIVAMAAVVAVSGLMMASVAGAATDKLIVKDSTGTNTVFKVDDAGQIGLPISTGLGRGVMFRNAAAQDNFPSVAAVPDGSTANQGISYQIIPRGTGFSAALKAQLTIFGTDLIADGVNYEAFVLRATGSAYSLNATKGGTGLPRPIQFQISNQAKMTIDTTGLIGIGTTTPTAALDVSSTGIRIRTANTPASSTATCNQGDISWDAGYVYVCVAADTWKRATLNTF